MQSKIKIFETGIRHGIMSRNKKFYPENKTEEEIKKIFLETRINTGKEFGFDGKKIFQALQKTETNNIEYEDGKYHVITEEDINNDDLWYVEIPADILIISKDYPKIVVGNQMADCPVLIVEDRKLGVTALSHCGAPYINRELPKHTVESLIKEYNSNVEDLYIYVGSFAKKENFIYDRYPKWATNEFVWKDAIIKNNDNYHIDMEQAIKNQFKEFNIQNITFSKYDTMTDNIHYSHSASFNGNKEKFGQNFVGLYYL